MACQGFIKDEFTGLDDYVDMQDVSLDNLATEIYNELGLGDRVVNVKTLKTMMIQCVFMEAMGNGFLPPKESFSYQVEGNDYETNWYSNKDYSLGKMFLDREDKIKKVVEDARTTGDDGEFLHICKKIEDYIGKEYFGILRDMLGWSKNANAPCNIKGRLLELIKRVNEGPKVQENKKSKGVKKAKKKKVAFKLIKKGKGVKKIIEDKITFMPETTVMVLESIPQYFSLSF
jgi:hypothetical protein